MRNIGSNTMQVFESYAECKRIILEWKSYFNDNEWRKILMKMDSLKDSRFTDEQKVKELQYAVTDLLWENDEARLLGFRAWLIEKRDETKNMLEYYERNENENRRISSKKQK